MTARAFLVAGLFLYATCIAVAQADKPRSAGREIVAAFVATCVQTMPKLAAVEAMARLAGWRKSSGDMLAAVGAANASSEANGWFVRSNTAPDYLVGINSGTFRNRSVSICTLASGSVISSEVEKNLDEILGTRKLIAEDKSGGQRMRIWQLAVSGSEFYMTYTDAPQLDPKVVTLGIMADR